MSVFFVHTMLALSVKAAHLIWYLDMQPKHCEDFDVFLWIKLALDICQMESLKLHLLKLRDNLPKNENPVTFYSPSCYFSFIKLKQYLKKSLFFVHTM